MLAWQLQCGHFGVSADRQTFEPFAACWLRIAAPGDASPHASSTLLVLIMQELAQIVPLRRAAAEPDRRAVRGAAIAATLAVAAVAQSPFQGNGQGQVYLRHTAAVIGGAFQAQFGSPAAPGGFAVLGLSDALGPTTNPITGLTGLDVTSPMLELLFFQLDGAGNGSFTAAVPNTPGLVQAAALFGLVAVFEPTLVSLSRTTRFAFENPDSASASGSLRNARAGHTATALGGGPEDKETRVFVVGGGGGTILVPQASRSTEIYSSLTRSPSPGPNLLVERALHAAIRLNDGSVLVCGGTSSTGIVTATAEIYRPSTGQFSAAAGMNFPRAGHAISLLPNGRVLVTGGLANYVNPTTNLAAVLNTAQNTGEIFDPAANTWTIVPGTMASTRSGHAHTGLANGQILITGGIQGGVATPFGFDLPVYTPSCNLYDPLTNRFLASGSMQLGRAFHGASMLGSGSVLITGGSVTNAAFGLVGATDTCELWTAGTFAPAGLLPTPVTNHVQFTAADGRAQLLGGLTGIFPALGGTAMTGRHDGVAFVAGRNLGENPGQPTAWAAPGGAMTGTKLHDGTWLLLGGTDGAAPLATSLIYLP